MLLYAALSFVLANPVSRGLSDLSDDITAADNVLVDKVPVDAIEGLISAIDPDSSEYAGCIHGDSVGEKPDGGDQMDIFRRGTQSKMCPPQGLVPTRRLAPSRTTPFKGFDPQKIRNEPKKQSSGDSAVQCKSQYFLTPLTCSGPEMQSADSMPLRSMVANCFEGEVFLGHISAKP